MALGQRQLVVLLLFFLVVASTAVPMSRTVKNQAPVGNFLSQDVKEVDKDDGLLKLEGLVEGRMNLEIADYPGTGANPNHDPPVPSGRV